MTLSNQALKEFQVHNKVSTMPSKSRNDFHGIVLFQRMAPPTYGDLGKAARDVFGKGFHFGLVKLDVKVYINIFLIITIVSPGQVQLRGPIDIRRGHQPGDWKGRD